MSGKVAADTSIIVPYLRKDPVVLSRFRETEEILIPFIVIGELFFGAFNSARSVKNLEGIESFCRDNIILSYSNDIAKEYGQIKTELKLKGRPIPENDIWIAAVARFHDLQLATRDDHFSNVSGISILKW